MSKNVVLEVPLELGGIVRIEVSKDGDVRVFGARKVVAVHKVQPTPQWDGDSKGVVVVSEFLGRAVKVVFEPVADSSWSSLGFTRPSFAAMLRDDDQTIEVSSIDCEGKEKRVLGIVPPRAALV